MALSHLVVSPRLSPKQMRVILGHIVQHCLRMRPALALLREVYTFVFSESLGVVPLPDAVLRELRLFRDVMLLASVDLAAPMSDTLYCSDSSSWGYALHISRADDPTVLRRISSVRERWRFVPV